MCGLTCQWGGLVNQNPENFKSFVAKQIPPSVIPMITDLDYHLLFSPTFLGMMMKYVVHKNFLNVIYFLVSYKMSNTSETSFYDRKNCVTDIIHCFATTECNNAVVQIS